MDEPPLVLLKVKDADGLEWNVSALLAIEAHRPGGQSRPTSLLLKPGASVTGIKVVESD